MNNGSGRGKVLSRPKASTPIDTINNLGGHPLWSKFKICNPNIAINQMGQGHLFEANLTIVAKVPHKIYGDMYASFIPQNISQNIMSQI
jgi:hypothetical protein